MSELSRHSRAMLLNVLWHHQGGSSAIGQAIRTMLGVGEHARLDDEQVAEAKWIDGLLSAAASTPAQAVSVPDVTEDQIVALVAGPYFYHHKMNHADIRAAEAFDRCRELTIQNIGTYFATRRAMLAAAPSPPPTSLADPIKVLADGTRCAPGDTRTDHVAVLLPAAGIMLHPVSLGTSDGDPLQNHAACEAACRDLRVLGHSDWRLASREDWNHILDLTRHDPAVDPNLYPGIKPHWHWTSTAAAWSASSAWGVGADGGNVCDFHRDGGGFALAVRRVGQANNKGARDDHER